MVRLKQEKTINPILNNLIIKKVNDATHLNEIYMDSYGYEKFDIDINFPKKLIFSENVYCLIAFYNKIPISSAILILNNNSFELDWVGTKKNYQGQGIALSILIEILKYSNKSNTYLVSSHKGRNLYEKFDFIKDYEIHFFKSILTLK